eukprot:Pgem_evm2s20129
MLERFKLQNCKNLSNPLPSLIENEGTELENDTRPYSGSLIYASGGTRPDIATSTSVVSGYNHNAKSGILQQCKNIMRYLAGTVDYGLQYIKKEILEVKCYVDADFAANKENRKSRTGAILTINGTPIQWESHLQKSVALSTCESEYIAMGEGIRMIKWLLNVLGELDIKVKLPITLYSDNQAAISVGNDFKCSKKVKHIDVKYHAVREMIDQGLIKLEYISSEENIADLFTKPLPTKRIGGDSESIL